MILTAKALQKFFSSFGLPAYLEETVPEDAALPYITYEVAEYGWRDSGAIAARIWYEGNSPLPCFEKADEIAAAIGEGHTIPTGEGFVYLAKGTPWAQEQPMDEKTKCVYLNFQIMTLTR